MLAALEELALGGCMFAPLAGARLQQLRVIKLEGSQIKGVGGHSQQSADYLNQSFE